MKLTSLQKKIATSDPFLSPFAEYRMGRIPIMVKQLRRYGQFDPRLQDYNSGELS